MFHKGKNGKEYANPQLRDHADKMSMKPMKQEAGQPGESKDNQMDRGGGDGDVPSHLEAMHTAMGGTHMHVHQGDDGKLTSHHVSEDGMVEGPHEHPNMEALHEHQKQVFGHQDENGDMMGGEKEPMPGLRHALSGM